MAETSEFCREQAERLLRLARSCEDFVLRRQLTPMAEAWLARAKEATSLARKIEPVLEAVESQMKKPGEAPEIKEAVAKATEYERLASSAKTGEDRDYYARMHRKWLRLADGWRFIADVDGRVRG